MFKTYYVDDLVGEILSKNEHGKNNKIKSIIANSKNRGDTLQETSQPLSNNDPDLIVYTIATVRRSIAL